MGDKRKSAPTLKEKQEAFYKSLIPYVEKYGKEVVRSFFDYWSEPFQKMSNKMRWEGEETWDLSRRLSRWGRTEYRQNKPMQTGVVLQQNSNKEFEGW